MLPRGGGDATNNRLRRAKSATSVQERKKNPLLSDSIDPETAHLHALVAAHRAMERSSERASEELRRSNSSTSRRLKGNDPAPRAQNVRFSPAPELRRQHSKLHAPRSVASTLDTNTEKTYVDDNQYRIHTTSDFGFAENYGAEPSSYKRLRRAKSMFTPRQWSKGSQNSAPQSAISTANTLRTVNSSLGLEEHRLKIGLKRSVSFLRASTNFAKAFKQPESEATHHDEAIQMARDQFLQDHGKQSLQEKPSLLFHPKTQQQQKVFRRSVRTNRTTDFGDGVKSENQAQLEVKPESRMRAVSISLRERVKRIFGKSVANRESFPAQQLDATRDHFRDYVDGSGAESKGFDNYHTGDPASVSRSSLYVASNQENESLEDLDKISATLRSATSCESLHSGSRSRVTSWTNSTTTGSLVNRSTPLERKRLSVIKEDGGPHQPSSSAGRHLGGVSVFSEPLRSQANDGRFIAPVDSQRIYSALIKRIDQEQVEMDRAQRELDQIHQERETVNLQARRDNMTIRPVKSEASLKSTAPDREHREFSVIAEVPSWEEKDDMTPEQHRENVEKRKERMRTLESQSTFFPFSSETQPTTPSPFKLALAAKRRGKRGLQNDSGYEEEGEETEGEASSVVHRVRGNPGLGQARYGMSDESVYSRTTEGGTNPTYITPIGSSEDVGLGMATIIPNRMIRYPKPTERVGRMQRQKSTPGSEKEERDWKGWLDRELWMQSQNQKTGLERSGSKASTRSQMSHVREHAQIVDGEEWEAGAGESHTKIRIAGPEMLKMDGQTQKTKVTNRFPLLELKEVPKSNTPAPKRSTSGSLLRSQSGVLLKRPSASGLKCNDENKKFGSGMGSLSLRKISPSNVTRVLKGKKSQYKRGDDGQGVGNSCKDDSPPVSTPGRLKMFYGGNGKIRGIAKAPDGGDVSVEATPTGNGSKKGKYQLELDNFDHSPASNMEKDWDSEKRDEHGIGLSARLSRPFDMDVPGQNRPFDSMFLGKGSGLLVGNFGRLSVAPAAMTMNSTPGFDGSVGDAGSEEQLATSAAATVMETSNGATPSVTAGVRGLGFGLSSKRMVSNFLRSRRKGRDAAIAVDADAGLAGAGVRAVEKIDSAELSGGGSGESPTAFV